ncbi:hypothetical protein ABZ470_31760 [Streptosporangium sp. NPDC020072]|uniref:hypothetical protein n=1 Tax=Streptosporangium sp. NPDC020072 TaxID=3154788 RepID=UPI00342355B2
MSFMLGSDPGNRTVYGARVWVPAGVAIASLWAGVRQGGTYASSPAENRLGVYDDDGTALGFTPNDDALWSVAGWRGGALPTPVPASTAGRFVYVLMLVGGYTGVIVPYPSSANDANAPWFTLSTVTGKRRAFYQNGVDVMPASFDPQAYGSITTYLPLLGIS